MSKSQVDHKILFDQLPVLRFVVEFKDNCFYVSSVNKLGLEFFNKSEEEVLGKNLSDIISVSSFNLLFESLKVSFKKKVIITVPVLSNPLKETNQSGFWINPVCNENNEVILLDVIGQPGTADVSVVRRERDDALSLLTSIFNTSEVGILVLDRHRRIVKVNDSFERIYGWGKEDTIGKDFLEFVTKDEREIAISNYEEFLKVDHSNSGEVKIICKDGTIDNAIFTTAALKLSHGRVFQVTTLVDITKRKQMELSLRVAKDRADSANNAKSVFLANMSHELRTPLNAIIGFSEMMVNESFGPLGNEKYNEYLSDVYMSAKHLLEIINEVLDMSKIEAGKIDLDEQEIDLNRLIRALTRLMNSKALNDNVSIEENYQKELPKLLADPRLVRQILINLITNSIKYSIHGGIITVKTSLNDKDEIEITVADQGVGIPENRIADALKPFGQIHDSSATHNKAYQGTGLGLPLAKAMVEMHGGVFTLKSAEGEGTTINMSFPSNRTRHH